MLGFRPYFDIRHHQDGQLPNLRAARTSPPKEIFWYIFLFESEWTQGLLNRNKEPENFPRAQHVSGVFIPIIKSSTTAVAASDFTVGAWW